MFYKIAIVDDEPEQIETIRSFDPNMVGNK